MSQSLNPRRLLAWSLAALMTIGSIPQANANGYPFLRHTHSREVVRYRYQPVRHVEWVVRFDPFGCPYRVPIVTYQSVPVPVSQKLKFRTH